MYPASKAAKFADKAEEAYDLALDYFRSADDVYHQVTVFDGVYDVVLLEAFKLLLCIVLFYSIVPGGTVKTCLSHVTCFGFIFLPYVTGEVHGT